MQGTSERPENSQGKADEPGNKETINTKSDGEGF